MVAISLNIQQRVHPIIWTVSSLPFDCTQVLPVKKPIGGCLIVSINALIYLNQSVPPFGVSLNSTADHSTSFPLSKFILNYLKKQCFMFVYLNRTTGWGKHKFRCCTNIIH